MPEPWPNALHVVDARSPGSGLVAVRIAAALAAEAGGSQRILFLGTGRERAAARAVAAETGAPAGALYDGPCPPLGDPTLAVRPLRRAVAGLESTHGRFDRLVGWGVAPSLSLALAVPGRARRTVSTEGAVGDRRLRRLARVGTGRLACLSEEASRSFVAASPAFGPIAELPLPPGSFRPVGSRESVRAAWEVDEATIVIGVLADDPRRCDLKHALDVLGFAAAAGTRTLMVVSPRSARLGPTREWTRTLRTFSIPSLGGGESRWWIADGRIDRPWSVVAGLDAAFIPGDGIATAGAAAFADRVGVLDRLLGPCLAAFDAGHRPRPVPGSPLPGLCAAAAGVPVLGPDDDCVNLLPRTTAGRGRSAVPSDVDAIDRWREFLLAG